LGRDKALKAGGNFPPLVANCIAEKAKGRPDGQGTLIVYTTKGRFNNQTLNKLIVIWIIRQSLPWLRIEDFLLRVAFDYTIHTAKLHSQIWAAAQADQLYLKQRAQVVKEIKVCTSIYVFSSSTITKIVDNICPLGLGFKNFTCLGCMDHQGEPQGICWYHGLLHCSRLAV
jgi:hypothetical protein